MSQTGVMPGIERLVPAAKAKVGLFSIGLAAYWPQFGGLRERLLGYGEEVELRVREMGAEVVQAGLVDDAAKARWAGDLFVREGCDFILCHVATYAASAQVLPVVQWAKAPVLVLNLQPTDALNYETADTGEWLANCSACCVPEISSAFSRSRIPFRVVSGMLHEDQRAWSEIAAWTRAAGVARSLRRARIGFLGHTYPGMLDLYADFTAHQAQLGIHIELLEMEDLQERVDQVAASEVEGKLKETRAIFDVDEATVDSESLRWSAKVAAGLERLVRDHDLDGLTYYYRGLGGGLFEVLGASLILGSSLLTAKGIPCSGEGDLRTCVSMSIMDRLGAGGSYTEFYAMDFREGFVLMGHDGPGHLAISDRRPILRGLSLYHGKQGQGVSVEFNVKTGPVTILSLVQKADARLALLGAQGESVPGPILRIGNTNSRLRFALDPASFVTAWSLAGPPHHCALGVGHQLGIIEKIADLLGLEVQVVCR